MNNVLKRNSPIYTDIEKFADYELTQCIAYEMAIRDSYYQKQVDEVIDYYFKNKINKMNINEINIEKKISHYGWLCHKINQIDTIPFSELEKFKIYEEPRYKRIYQIIKILHNANILAYTQEEELAEEEKYDKKTTYIQNMDGYNIITTIIKDKWKDEEKDFKGVPYSTDNNNIENNFKRPKIKTDDLVSATPKVEINLTLPKDEIIAYIEHIKKTIDKKKLAPVEVLENKLQKSDTKVCPKKGKCFESKNLLSKQEKLADMFYIYDCLQKGNITQDGIAQNLITYYDEKYPDKESKYDVGTIKRYNDILVDYIDNNRFIELLTGVRVQDIRTSVKTLNTL